MNRNQMYLYLKDKGMYPCSIYRGKRSNGKGKFYHTEFRLNQETQQSITIITDWGYIRGCTSIHLCTNELVVESDYGQCKINIYYKNIEKFEVRVEEIEE